MGGLGIAGALTSGLRLITKAIFDKSSDGLRKGACNVSSNFPAIFFLLHLII